MYNESGPKIKKFAHGFFIIGCILSGVGGLSIAFKGSTTEGGIWLMLLGVLIAVAAGLICWLLSILISSYGELVDDTHRASQQQYTISKEQAKTNKLLEEILTELKKQNENKNANV